MLSFGRELERGKVKSMKLGSLQLSCLERERGRRFKSRVKCTLAVVDLSTRRARPPTTVQFRTLVEMQVQGQQQAPDASKIG